MKTSAGLNKILLLCLVSLLRTANSYGRDAGASVAAGSPVLQEDRIRTLVDRFFAERMARRHMAGAVFVLVKDGQVLFSTGYGYANLQTKAPFSPESTIFRAGSISKLFTATAVMQLCERGRLKLDENVNSYLKHFRLEDTFPRPVTLAHLLTHTAGFAEYIHGQHRLDRAQWQPLAEYLTERMPPRVLPPGEMFSYNDHGVSLAGLIVEETAGIPFADYMARNLFKPLGMERSTFDQRPAPELLGDLAVGYEYREGANVPYALDYVETVPAAGLYTTARDISRFMIAHLQYGLLGETRILAEPTAREMQARHFIHHPSLRGRAYGFSELFINGRRIIFHDGAMPGFTSRLCLLPEAGAGFFVCCNSDDLGTKSSLTVALMDSLFPPQSRFAPAAPTPVPGRIADFTGYYDQIAGFATNGLRLGAMLQNHAYAGDAGGNRLRVFGSEYREIDPLLFQDGNGNHVAFGKDDRGRIRYLYAGSGAYEKLGLLESPTALLCLAGIFVLASLPMGVAWPLAIAARPGRFRAYWNRIFPSGRLVAGVECFLTVFFLVAFAALFMQLDSYWVIMRNEYPWSWVTRLLALPIVIAALAPLLLFYAIRAWVKKQGTTFGRVCMSGVAGATAFFVWTLWQWHLIGFNY